jgi:hypothetical protein
MRKNLIFSSITKVIVPALCLLLVACQKGDAIEDGEQQGVISLRVTDILTNVNADHPEAVEADLATNTPWVEGGGMNLMGGGGPLPNGDDVYPIRFVDADHEAIADGTLILKAESAGWSPAFDFLSIDTQIEYTQKWVFETDGEEWESNLYVVRGIFTRLDMPDISPDHFRLYEDWTEYYRTKYPEAGVRSAARVLISTGSR